MSGRMSNTRFRLMSLVGMPVRNLFQPPGEIVKEMDIVNGSQVLDFGCGPGHFIGRIARLTGERGVVYALDNHPLAIKRVNGMVRRNGFSNVRTILSDCSSGLDDSSIDAALLLDVYHMLDNGPEVLAEIHRVLKPEGKFYFSDHHLKENGVRETSVGGFFTVKSRGRYLLVCSPSVKGA